MRKIERISIGAADRERLDRLIRDRNTPQKVVWRARIVRLAGDGLTAVAIAAAVGKSVLTVRRWRRRYEAKGVDGLLKDATRPPRRKPLTAEKINQVVHMTLHAKPPNATHWSLRRMAAAAGLSHSSVQRIWQAHGLKPHRVETFKLSNDPQLVEKIRDIVGPYLDPPAHAAVVLRRRETADPGVGAHAAPAAAAARSDRTSDARLQAARHHDVVRRAQRQDQ